MRIEESLAADVKVMESISRNIANARTDGYRRTLTTPVFEAHMEQQGAQAVVVTSSVDESSGALRYTGRSLDFAIEGNGYFELQGPGGPLFTRRGMFAVDAKGYLVTQQGYPVIGLSGPIVVGHGELTSTPAGELYSGNEAIGRLALARPVDGSLREVGEGYYQMSRDDAVDVSVRQGFAESSNVSLLDEMMSMVTASRHFALGQRVFATRDALVGDSIKKLGEV